MFWHIIYTNDKIQIDNHERTYLAGGGRGKGGGRSDKGGGEDGNELHFDSIKLIDWFDFVEI